jgi:D-beta-D-heptose 7-phosphate kinase/D-beta-D-heptose 1-phosphate adenosyltransferase
MKVVLVTGGFDPLHSGHIAYFKAAKSLGDILLVGVNSDEWLQRKKGREFMPWNERATIIEALGCVDRVINFNDDDGSATDAIRKTRSLFPKAEIIFANGGDRQADNIPELFDDNTGELTFVYGVGGEDKKNSSSWILEDYKHPKTERQWGYYRVLHEYGNTVKVKELTVNPGKMLSMQRHKDRAEHWFIARGEATVYTVNRSSTDYELLGTYKEHQSLHIDNMEWHMLANETDKPLQVVEIQYGKNCVEEDIERK